MAERVAFSPREVMFHVKRGQSFAPFPERSSQVPASSGCGTEEAFDRFT